MLKLTQGQYGGKLLWKPQGVFEIEWEVSLAHVENESGAHVKAADEVEVPPPKPGFPTWRCTGNCNCAGSCTDARGTGGIGSGGFIIRFARRLDNSVCRNRICGGTSRLFGICNKYLCQASLSSFSAFRQ